MAAPKNPNGGAKLDKEWRDAIRMAVHETRDAKGDGKVKKVKALRLLASKLVDKGLDGDVAAMREIGDRLDGKPRQELDHSGELDHNYIARLPATGMTIDQWQQDCKLIQ